MPVATIGILQHVSIVLKDLEGARHLFRDIFGLSEAKYLESPDGPAYAFRTGKTVLRVVTPKAAEASLGRRGLHHLTFRVESLARTRERLKKAGISILSSAPPGPNGRPALWADPANTIGILLQFVEQGDPLEFSPVPTGGVIDRMDHLGVVCRDREVARRVYVEGLGFPLESSQPDTEAIVPSGGIPTHFITIGEFELEIMQPTSSVRLEAPLGSIPKTPRQDQTTLARYLERRGEGLIHICFKTLEIQQALDTVAVRGVKLIDPIGRPGGRAGSIAFLDHKSTQNILFHFVQRTPR